MEVGAVVPQNVLSNGKSSVGLVSTTGTTDRGDLAAGL